MYTWIQSRVFILQQFETRRIPPYNLNINSQSPSQTIFHHEQPPQGPHQNTYPTAVLNQNAALVDSPFKADNPSSYTMQAASADDFFVESLLQTEAACVTNMNHQGWRSSNSSSPVTVTQESEVSTVNRAGHFYTLCGFQEFGVDVSTVTGLLMVAAQAVESANQVLAADAVAEISNILLNQADTESPSSNVVFHLTLGLSHKCSNNTALTLYESIPPEIDTKVPFNMFLELSPHEKFAQFTANQAILEASKEAREVHILDLDIMEGIQWPPLMADLAQRKDIALKITAFVADKQKAALMEQTGRRLVEFAESVGLPFRFDQMVVEKEDDFDIIEAGQTLIANCIIHQLHMTNRNLSFMKTFLNGVSKLSAKMVVLVEDALFNFVKVSSTSFVDFFSEAIQHYTAYSDSLAHNYASEGLCQFINETLGLKILDTVKNFPTERLEKMLWEDSFASLKAFKPIPLSGTNVSQAKLLASLSDRGYWVENENHRLSLCWNSRPLTTTSVWVPRQRISK